MSAPIPKQQQHYRQPQLLQSMKEELCLYQEECAFYQKLLMRNIEETPRTKQLQQRLQKFSTETLCTLQQALRSLEGQSSNTTTAQSGRSHLSLFTDGLEEARLHMNTIKQEALRLLNKTSNRMMIW